MLEEIGELTLTTAWKKVRSLIKDDPRYAKFSSSDRVCDVDCIFSDSIANFHFCLYLEMWKGVQRIHERQNGSCQSWFPWALEGKF